MSGVNVKYKDNTIANMTETGTKTVKTGGKYCEGDISVEYSAPSGSQDITENGTYDVTDIASVIVNVAGAASDFEVKKWEFTIDSDVTNGGTDSGTMFFNDAWIGEHFNDENLVMAWYPKNEKKTAGIAASLFGMCANRKLASIDGGTAVRYGSGMRVNSSDSYSVASYPVALNGYDTNVGKPRIYANGNFTIFCNSSYPLRAGTYNVVAWVL